MNTYLEGLLNQIDPDNVERETLFDELDALLSSKDVTNKEVIHVLCLLSQATKIIDDASASQSKQTIMTELLFNMVKNIENYTTQPVAAQFEKNLYDHTEH